MKRAFENYLRIRFILLLSGLLCFSAVISQVPDDLALELSKRHQRVLARASGRFYTAKSYINEAILYTKLENDSSNNEASAINKYHKSAEYMKKATTTVYKTYKKNADVFWRKSKKEGAYLPGLEKARYMEREAKKILAEATLLLEQVEQSNSIEEITGKLERGRKLCATVVTYQGRALQLYQEYPIEYIHEWKNDIDVDDISSASKISGYSYLTILNYNENQIFKSDTGIIYKIQIAAHTAPLTEEYIKTIYNGNERIHLLKEERWYKYSIGTYRTYKAASAALSESGVSRAFIVSYKKGKRIDIKAARQLTK